MTGFSCAAPISASSGGSPRKRKASHLSRTLHRTSGRTLVDALVSSPGFDSHLFNWTADLLRIQTNQEQFGLGWHVWLRKSLSEDKPWDDLVREMLSSNGHAAKRSGRWLLPA